MVNWYRFSYYPAAILTFDSQIVNRIPGDLIDDLRAYLME